MNIGSRRVFFPGSFMLRLTDLYRVPELLGLLHGRALDTAVLVTHRMSSHGIVAA